MKINYPAVLVAAVIHFVLGGIWYGVFGNKFIQLIGWSQEKLDQVGNRSHVREYLFAFLSSLILVYILAHFIQYTRARNVVGGMQTAFWLWLGFVASTQISTVIFEERKMGLYLLNIGYQLVACLLAGALLAVWGPREASERLE